MNTKILVFILTLLILISGVVTVTGCIGYKKFSLTEGSGHFSFEHPRNYKKHAVNIDTDLTYVIFYRSLEGDIEHWDSWIEVWAYEPGLFDHTSARDALDDDILRESNEHNEYQLIKRNAITTSTIEGEQYLRSYTVVARIDEYDYMKDPSLVARGIYLDYNGLVWEIYMASIEAIAETDEAVWEHLITTFKFLN